MIKTIEDYKKAGEELFNVLNLNTYPVSLKYIKDLETEIPPGVRRPAGNVPLTSNL